MATITTEQARVAKILADIDDAIAVCRAWGHEWPSRKLRPGKPLPKGYRPRLMRDGCVEVTESCLNDCGKRRWFVLAPGGVYDGDSTVRRYLDPPNWKVIHADQHVGRFDFQAEVTRRSNEDIMTAARANRLDGEDGDTG